MLAYIMQSFWTSNIYKKITTYCIYLVLFRKTLLEGQWYGILWEIFYSILLRYWKLIDGLFN